MQKNKVGTHILDNELPNFVSAAQSGAIQFEIWLLLYKYKDKKVINNFVAKQRLIAPNLDIEKFKLLALLEFLFEMQFRPKKFFKNFKK